VWSGRSPTADSKVAGSAMDYILSAMLAGKKLS
jgi:hypothetical protein